MTTTSEITARLAEALPNIDLANAGVHVTATAVEVDLFALAAKLGLGDAESLLPPQLVTGLTLKLTDFSIAAPRKFNLTVETDLSAASGAKLAGALELGVMSCKIALDPDANTDKVAVQLTAHATVFGTAMTIAAASSGGPLLIVTADADPSQFTLSRILQVVNLPGAGFEALHLSKLGLSISIPLAFIRFSAEVDQPWSVALGSTSRHFALDQVALQGLYFAGPDGGIAGAVQAKGSLGSLAFAITAEYLPGDDGWAFTGTAKDLQPGDVLEQFGFPANEFPLDGFTAKSVELSYNTASKDFHFKFDGEAHLGANQTFAIVAQVDITSQPAGGFEKFFSGKMIVDSTVEFDLVFDQEAGKTSFAGVFNNVGQNAFTLKQLADALSLGLPQDLQAVNVNVKDVLVAYQKDGAGSNFLCAVDTDINVDLSGLRNLPVVGSAFGPGQSLAVGVTAFITSQHSAHPFDTTALKKILPAGSPTLPDELTPFDLALRVHFGDFSATIHGTASRPLTIANSDLDKSDSGASSAPTPPASSSDIKWVEVQKHFGPLSVQRVGAAFTNGTISVLLEAELSVSGLTLSVEGLGANYSIASREVHFALEGLGLDFKKGDLEIGGGFLNVEGDFAGKIVIKTKTFSITALGAVAVVGGEPSIFIYGILDYPIGGPSFFYVEGLAAGFGYNRSFRLPTIEGVREFPLVQDAVKPAAAAKQLSDARGSTPSVKGDKAAIAAQLARLHEFIAPSAGEYFFAAGIKFSSFKLVNSFVLVAVVFGRKFEIDLLGVSTYQNPPELVDGVPALAHIELNVLGRIAPDEGFMGIEARLTNNSYIYSNLCQISGGFAFYSWFGDNPNRGDFVLSVGGYHPAFVKPPHYPDVPRLSLTYQITPKIYVKGTAYFALTPSVLMAGGSLEARAEVGSASAWFLASIDFFVSWEPYHYDLQLQIAIGAKWWIFETELSAKLTIWGPEFSGRAEISWTVFKFTVDFGASASRGPVPIRFAPFQSKFIPDVNKVVSVRVTEGIRGSVVDSSGGTSELPVVNPAGLVFELRSSVPAKTVIAQLEDSNALGDVPLAPSPRAEVFGIAPMNVNAVASSAIRFTIKRDGVALPRADFMAHFRAVPIEQGFPTGMWGRKLKLDPAEKSVVVALAGYTISAAPPAREPSPGKRRDADEFKFGNLPNPAFPPPSTAGPVQFQAAGDITLAGVLQGETAVPVAKFRSDLLKTLGIEPTDAVTIGASLPGSFLTKNSAPKMVKV